jgi:hypothetical protein
VQGRQAAPCGRVGERRIVQRIAVGQECVITGIAHLGDDVPGPIADCDAGQVGESRQGFLGTEEA